MVKLKVESLLQAKICKELQSLVQGRVVARCDNDQWLETQSRRARPLLTPDAIIIHKAFLIEKNCDTEGLLRGIPARKTIYFGTAIVDFKLENSHEAFGELGIHL